MTLELHFHPLASYCMKALIALYENETPFEPHKVDLGDQASRAAFLVIAPMGKMPALRDRQKGKVVTESTIVIEYLGRHHPGKIALVPTDPERALDARYWERFFDNYVMTPMQKIVGDRNRPKDKKDPFGVAEARAQLATAYGMIDRQMKGRTWALGDAFTLAECAAAPSLYFANKVLPIGAEWPNTAAYLARLLTRPSFARVVEEAGPYLKFFPTGD
jgi:glutathione S-transferase